MALHMMSARGHSLGQVPIKTIRVWERTISHGTDETTELFRVVGKIHTGSKNEIRSCGNNHTRFPCTQGLNSLVNRDETGRACRINRHGRSSPVKEIGNAV